MTSQQVSWLVEPHWKTLHFCQPATWPTKYVLKLHMFLLGTWQLLAFKRFQYRPIIKGKAFFLLCTNLGKCKQGCTWTPKRTSSASHKERFFTSLPHHHQIWLWERLKIQISNCRLATVSEILYTFSKLLPGQYVTGTNVTSIPLPSKSTHHPTLHSLLCTVTAIGSFANWPHLSKSGTTRISFFNFRTGFSNHLTGCSFYRVPEHSSSHGLCRQMQGFRAIKHPCWRTGWTSSLLHTHVRASRLQASLAWSPSQHSKYSDYESRPTCHDTLQLAPPKCTNQRSADLLGPQMCWHYQILCRPSPTYEVYKKVKNWN